MSRTYLYTIDSNTEDVRVQPGLNPSHYGITNIESGPHRHQTGIYNENNSYLHDLNFHLDLCNTTICKCICKIPNLVC